MLKAQDIVILLKILSNVSRSAKHPAEILSQNTLATHLCMSPSEVHAGIGRLINSGLLGELPKQESLGHARRIKIFLPIKSACEEFLISGVKYFFPVQLGEYTRGIPTSYAAPIFEKQIQIGKDPIPVWPYAEGTHRGLAIQPLYRSVPKSLALYPDQMFYELLVLIDAIRSGRAREKNIAIKLLKEIIHVKK